MIRWRVSVITGIDWDKFQKLGTDEVATWQGDVQAVPLPIKDGERDE
jgi:hypothetical protein